MLLWSRPITSDSLWPPRLQHARPPWPSPSPEVYLSSCPLQWWCHPAISSSDALFFCPRSFRASGTFPMSRLFASGNQNSGAWALWALELDLSISPFKSVQGWFPWRLTGLISFLSKGLSGESPDWPDDRIQFTLIQGPNIPSSYAILFFAASHFTFITRHIHNWSFPLWASHFILSGAVSSSPLFSPGSILDTFLQFWGNASFGVISFCPLEQFMRFSWQVY